MVQYSNKVKRVYVRLCYNRILKTRSPFHFYFRFHYASGSPLNISFHYDVSNDSLGLSMTTH